METLAQLAGPEVYIAVYFAIEMSRWPVTNASYVHYYHGNIRYELSAPYIYDPFNYHSVSPVTGKRVIIVGVLYNPFGFMPILSELQY